MKQQYEITVKDRRTGSVIKIDTPNLAIEINQGVTAYPEAGVMEQTHKQTFKLSGVVAGLQQKHKVKRKAKKK